MASISKIVSGGQTGVDRAALDVAIFLELEHGGYCPRGRRAEGGPIPDIYQLVETEKRDYSVRTEMNVVHSDATLILYRIQMSRGTDLTRRLAKKHKREHLAIDLGDLGQNVVHGLEGRGAEQIREVALWLKRENISVLNVAGPRESSSPGITKAAEAFLTAVLQDDVGSERGN